jgi:hypothetical protein
MQALATDGPRRSGCMLREPPCCCCHHSREWRHVACVKPVDLLPVPGAVLEQPVHVAVLDGVVTDCMILIMNISLRSSPQTKQFRSRKVRHAHQKCNGEEPLGYDMEMAVQGIWQEVLDFIVSCQLLNALPWSNFGWSRESWRPYILMLTCQVPRCQQALISTSHAHPSEYQQGQNQNMAPSPS